MVVGGSTGTDLVTVVLVVAEVRRARARLRAPRPRDLARSRRTVGVT
jgi:hypothetical protein